MIIDVNEETFIEDVLEQSEALPVIVDFWAPWCGPCRMLSPILEGLVADPSLNFVLAKVNVDNNPNLSMQYRVQSIPAVLAFVDGDVADEFIGVQPEAKIRQFIQQLIPSELDEALDDAESLLATRHWAKAEQMLRDLIEEHPERPYVALNLAKALLAQGEGCEARDFLKTVKDGQELIEAEKLLPLAKYLCLIAEDLTDDEALSPLEVQYRQGARLISRGNLEAAMDGLLDVLRQDKRYGQARQVMLALFALLGDDDELTQTYRTELATVLF
ncbi:MAG: thioredoxin [Ardenticatenaceae bacterium]|nr:thioredoxin [Anaerolineales bacterium]MCB8941142.1 thioredoxin [Ardenticatenaceae bacterium]MCB8972483.1 thioredoxin [Ardenticatenaceae bacterium]